MYALDNIDYEILNRLTCQQFSKPTRLCTLDMKPELVNVITCIQSTCSFLLTFPVFLLVFRPGQIIIFSEIKFSPKAKEPQFPHSQNVKSRWVQA